MKNKIGIITITSGEFLERYNYGNKLQNYALTKVISDMGYKPQTILYKPKYPDNISQTFNLVKKNSIFQFVDDVKRVLYRKIKKQTLNALAQERINKFKEFNDNLLDFSKKYTYDDDLSKLDNLFDLFVIGSDQVWNPYYEGNDSFYFGDFTTGNKVVTYAPSIAVSDIPEEQFPKYSNCLQKLDNITIREQDGKNLLLNRFNVDSTLVCDPVFLLSKDEWKNISSNETINEKFAFTYLLGKKSVNTKKQIKNLIKKNNVKLLDVFTADDPKSQFIGPKEFINYFDKCEFVITDSFHALAFAIIFDKPVVIVDRNNLYKTNKYNMSSRITSLLSLVSLDLKDVFIDNILKNNDLLKNIKYYKEEFNLFINKSHKFLENIINEKLN